MPRNYRHIKEYEKEILKLKEEGFTKREIGDKLGFSYEQIHNFISRYNERQRRIWVTDISYIKTNQGTLSSNKRSAEEGAFFSPSSSPK